jgi:TPR repeat protein
MKKILILVVAIVLAALAAVVYWWEPARNVALQGWNDYAVPAWHSVKTTAGEMLAGRKAEKSEPAAPTESPEPAPAQPAVAETPAADTTPAAEPAAAPAAAESTPEPEPEPAPVGPEPLPALNAEAEALLPKAEAGDAVAQFNLARQYALGEGMAINREEFIRWCRTASDQGLPEAQYALGCCYMRGLIVEKDEAEARRLLESAAEVGFAPAADALKEF